MHGTPVTEADHGEFFEDIFEEVMTEIWGDAWLEDEEDPFEDYEEH